MKSHIAVFLFLICLINFKVHGLEKTLENSSLVSHNLKGKLSVKQADKIDEGVDGLGANADIGKSSGAPIPIIVNGSPFKIIQCNQIVMFEAEYIENLKDYRKKVQGFFMANVYSVHLFKEKNAETLIHTVNYSQMEKIISPLKGAKGCLILDGGKVSADLTICFKSESDTLFLMEAFNTFAKCRKGDNLVEISPEQLKELSKSCSENSSQAKLEKSANQEISLSVRPNNKWDLEREKYFQPLPIIVPGTPPKKAELS